MARNLKRPELLPEAEPSPRIALPPFAARRGYRIEEAAAYMGLSPFYVEEICRSGDLRSLELCRHRTILKEDMDAYLDSERDKVPPKN